MKKKIKAIGLITLFTVIYLGVFAPTPTGVVAKPSQGITLKVAVSDQQVDLINVMKDEYIAATDGVDAIEVVATGSGADDQYDNLVSTLTAGGGEYDVIHMDVIWPAGFVKNGWLEDLSDMYPQAEQDKYLKAHMEAGIVDGKVYASPFFFDSGLVLYRQDILERNGLTIDDFKTWADFKTNLNKILDNATEAALNPNLEGYVFQGDEYEGGIVNLVEWMGGSGGTFLNDAGTAGNFAASAEPALTWWKSLIAPRYTTALNNPDSDAVSERSELVSDEGSAVSVWIAGNAVFQRNWPFSYLQSQENAVLNGSQQLKFANGTVQPDPWFTQNKGDRFGVTTLPYNATICGANNDMGCRTAVLGGAVLGVPADSTHKDEAKDLLAAIASEEWQLAFFKDVGNFPAIKSAYTEENMGAGNFALDFYENVFPNVLPRPVHADYAEISAAIQPYFHDALSGVTPVSEALEQMDDATNLVLSGSGVPGFEVVALFGSLMAIYILHKRKKN